MQKRWLDLRMLGGCLLLAMLAPRALAQLPAARMPISSRQVAAALTTAGWKVASAQVEFLTQVTSNHRDPALQVMEVSRWRANSAKAKLRCRDGRVCLPFYVLVEGAKQIPRVQNTENAYGKPAFNTAPRPPLMRGGDRATLVFADKGLRITIPVICLQSGYRGQTIRVTSSDRRRFFTGEIVGPGLIRATAL